MTDGEHELRVSYDRETPDTFVDGSEVVVEGSLGPNGVFVARTLLAKCPSKYEAANTEADYKMGGYENREGATQGDAPQPAAPR